MKLATSIALLVRMGLAQRGALYTVDVELSPRAHDTQVHVSQTTVRVTLGRDLSDAEPEFAAAELTNRALDLRAHFTRRSARRPAAPTHSDKTEREYRRHLRELLKLSAQVKRAEAELARTRRAAS